LNDENYLTPTFVLEENENLVLEGGENKDNEENYVIPTFVPKSKNIWNEPKNTPFVPNKQKEIYNELHPQKEFKQPQSQQQSSQQGQVLNLQLYQPPKPRSNTNTGSYPHPAVFYPNYNSNNTNPASNLVFPYNLQQPVYKEYNININGVAGSHVKTSMLFEDVLPIKDASGTFNSISERITTHEFIRSMFFSNGDGNDMPIDQGIRNMLSRLKILDMNPYNASRLSKNPYKGLPYGFLLYRTCYPIQYDKQTSSSVCSPSSTGANIRIYKITDESYKINKLEKVKINDYDEWRDITFYTYVRENVIKKKICPHFPIMFGFNITVSSSIKFDNIHKQGNIIDKHFNSGKNVEDVQQKGGNPQKFLTSSIRQSVRQKFLAEYQDKKNLKQESSKQELKESSKQELKESSNSSQLNDNSKEEQKKKLSQQEEIEMLKKYTGKTIVCLTEAPHYSIIGWSKKEYRSDGNVKTMINTGYHPVYVWESILFQLMVGLYVLQQHKIVINNFNIDRHVFIRDIDLKGISTRYWKYKINGIDYYIQNYGYMLLIDTNFKDFDKDDVRKLEGDIFNDTITDIDKRTFEMFKSAFNTNVYGDDFINDNGVKPPEEVLKFINSMNYEDDKYDISYYIRKYMTIFMNNRIGTPLKDTEISNVRKTTTKEFKKGQLLVMADNNNIDKFVLHVSQTEGESIIIKRDDMTNMKNFTEEKVPSSSLNEYVNIESLQQNFKGIENIFNDDNMIETYIV